MESINEIFSFIGFVLTMIVFIWFGVTMNAIKRNTAKTAANAEIQTKILDNFLKRV